MRNVRIILGLAVALCALGMSAASALAAPKNSEAPEFKASKVTKKGPAAFPLKLKGEAVGPQEFTFKKLKVVCEVAKVSGSIPEETSKTLALEVTYKECTSGPLSYGNIKKVDIPIKFKEKGLFTYHYNGWVDDEEEIEMKAKYIGCVLDWESGTIPEKAEEFEEAQYSSATYAPEGSKLLITNAFKKAGWEEEGGGLCEEEIELHEGEQGRYNGSLLVEVPKGGTIGLAE
jgi:hypothetical protein